MTTSRQCGDRGSLIVELVVLAPVLFMFALCALVFGRVTEARQQITASARAAAQAAAVMPSAQSAVLAASANGVIGHYGPSQTCAQASVSTDVTNFRPGGTVRVTVTCKVHLSDLSFPGIPGSTSISVSTVAPLDPYRSVQ
jgi:Flp pilus assembly protein TadG